MDFLRTFGLFVLTAIAEIVGCYLPYLWLKGAQRLAAGAGGVEPRRFRLASHSASSSCGTRLCSLWRRLHQRCACLGRRLRAPHLHGFRGRRCLFVGHGHHHVRASSCLTQVLGDRQRAQIRR